MTLSTMFVESKVRYSTLFTNFVRWHASAVSCPLNDVIWAQLAWLTEKFVENAK
jgi:hypothetical protein